MTIRAVVLPPSEGASNVEARTVADVVATSPQGSVPTVIHSTSLAIYRSDITGQMAEPEYRRRAHLHVRLLEG